MFVRINAVIIFDRIFVPTNAVIIFYSIFEPTNAVFHIIFDSILVLKYCVHDL